MKKSINNLGCKCKLPENQNIKRFVCPECQTRYQRNPFVLRWYLVWIAETVEEMIVASLPAARLASINWANSPRFIIEAPTDDPTASSERASDDPTTDHPAIHALNNPVVECCGRDAADCDCTHQEADRALNTRVDMNDILNA